MNFFGQKRTTIDITKLIMNRYDVETLCNNEYSVRFYGPKGTAYDGGVWDVHVVLPENYPFKSPTIEFINPIFHPNVRTETGSVCLDVLGKNWSPLYDLYNVFESFLPQLLTYPNPFDPLNAEAANLFLFDQTSFIKTVKMFIEKYATVEMLKRKVKVYYETAGGA